MEFEDIRREIEEHRSRLVQGQREKTQPPWIESIDLQKCKEILNLKEINTDSTYYRAIKGQSPSLDDFETPYKETSLGRPYRRPINEYGFCRYHGVSLFTDLERIKEIFRKIREQFREDNPQTQRLFLGRLKYVCKFKFASDAAGLISAPNSKNDKHRTFYKSDGFNLSMIDALEIDPLWQGPNDGDGRV